MAMKPSTSFTDQIYKGFKRSKRNMTRRMFSTIGSLSLRVRRRRSNDNLSSFVECDAEILTAESGTSLAQENVVDLWITSKYRVFLEVLRLILKY